MEPEACRSCGSTLLDDDAFCGDCGAQVRCHGCHVLLKPSKQFCTQCGTRCGEESIVSTADCAPGPPSGMNSLRLKEDKASRLLELSFTDHVAESISAPLTAYMAGQIGALSSKGRPSPIRNTSVIEEEMVALPPASEQVARGKDPARATTTTPGLAHGLEQIFMPEGERLWLRDTRLKGDSKLDTARRLTHLFLYTHSQLGRERVPLADLHLILGEAAVDDSNTRKMLRQSPAELWPDGDMIGLRPGGEEKARGALADFLNPERPIGWTATAAKPRATKATASGTDAAKDKAKPARRSMRISSTPVDGWVAAWKQLHGQIEGHRLLKDKSSGDRGIFGLWAIHEAAGDEGKVVSRHQLAAFLFTAFVLKVDQRNLGRALDKDKNDKVINVSGTRYQLTPSGIAYARQMAGLAQEPLRAVQ